MLQIITAIALWCSVPVNSTKGSIGFKTGTDLSITEINQCRERLLKCIEKQETLVELDPTCFKNEKLK